MKPYKHFTLPFLLSLAFILPSILSAQGHFDQVEPTFGSVNILPREEGELVVRLRGDVRPFQDDEVDFMENQHFFSLVEVDQIAHWRMIIWNLGEEDVIIHSIESTDEAFAAHLRREMRLRPDDRFSVDVTFAPVEDILYEGELHVEIEGEEDIVCYLAGVGVEGWDNHFYYFNTRRGHAFVVENTTLEGDDLEPGDEVAAFTPAGLCVGAAVIQEDGRAGFTAYVDNNPDDEINNGFRQNEEISFRVWDSDAEIEAPAEPEWIFGQEVFTLNGLSRLELHGSVIPPPPILYVSDDLHYYGQVDYDEPESVEWEFFLQNRGEGDLIISSIESDLDVFEVDYDGMDDDVVLQEGQQRIITVIFTPEEEGEFIGRLTIDSNDPFDPQYYVDVEGFGVLVERLPFIELRVWNYFFGVRHIQPEDPYEFILEIINVGTGPLLIEDIRRAEGSDAFQTDFEREIFIEPEEMHELSITFNPEEADQYDAVFTIVSNDLMHGEIDFPVRGYGSDSDDHFLHRETETSMLINVERAFEHLENEEDGVDLCVDDEIAVFTPAGLCVGHVILGEGGEIPDLLAWGDDHDTEVLDGFIAEEEMSFRVWDVTRDEELEVTNITIVEGDETFIPNGETTVILAILIDEHERQVASNPENYDFGPIHVDAEAECVLSISNAGDEILIVSDVETNIQQLDHDFNRDDIWLAGGESFDLTVSFTPTGASAYANGTVTVHSNDPDEPEYVIHITGTGSDAEGHYDYFHSDYEHGLIVFLSMRGEEPFLCMEVGVFTPGGLCAGADIVENQEEPLGVTAFGDDDRTPYLLEGFRQDEEFNFRVWDDYNQREYSGEDLEVEFINGRETWRRNDISRISIDVVRAFYFEPVHDEWIIEGDRFTPELFLIFPPDYDEEYEFRIELLNSDIIEGLGDWLIDVDPPGHFIFAWETNEDAGSDEPYILRFRAWDPEDEDVQAFCELRIRVLYSQPQVNDEMRLEIFGEDDEFHIDEDADWTVIIPDLNRFFFSPDELGLDFSYSNVQYLNQRITEDEEQYSYWIRTNPQQENWNGEVNCRIEAEDGQEFDRDRNARSLRRVNASNMQEPMQTALFQEERSGRNPGRDLSRSYSFTLIVDPVNDAPEIYDPETGQPYEIDVIRAEVVENEEFILDLEARDIDNEGGELSWSMADDGGLPEPVDDNWSLSDNEDGTARFTWTPGFDDSREEPYRPVFRVEDPDGANDGLTVEINVVDVNRRPAIANRIPDMEIDEDPDPRRVEIADLDDVFFDPDGDELRFFNIETLDELHLLIEDGNILTIEPELNFNLADGTEITVGAADDETAVYTSFILTINPVPDPPVITDPETGQPYEAEVSVEVAENEELVFDLEARDEDNEGSELSWSITDNGGLPEPVDDNWSFSDNEDGTARFTWTPGFDDSREEPYSPLFRVEDPDGATDELMVEITVINVNRGPEIASDITDIEIDEDPDPRRFEIADLDTVFTDPDGDELRFFNIETLDELNLQLDDLHILFIEPEGNFNLPEGTEITVGAADDESAVNLSFRLTINPVNDAPDPFGLLSPDDGHEIERENYRVDFAWEEAADPEDDQVTYTLYLHAAYDEIDTTLRYEGIDALELAIEHLDSLLIDLGIFIHVDVRIDLRWWVTATDDEDVTESTERRIISVPIPFSVDSDHEIIPTEFSLDCIYPNPFNSSTTITYSLPLEAAVRLKLYDMTGHEIFTLIDGFNHSGTHSVTLNASDLPAGLYFVRLEASGHIFTRKILLIR